jgi:hypothetical protein
MVILAHEREVLGVIPLLEADGTHRGILEEWQKAGWKETKMRDR